MLNRLILVYRYHNQQLHRLLATAAGRDGELVPDSYSYRASNSTAEQQVRTVYPRIYFEQKCSCLILESKRIIAGDILESLLALSLSVTADRSDIQIPITLSSSLHMHEEDEIG